jgi:pimeloyl-ACP methyl ester carboxylesterase
VRDVELSVAEAGSGGRPFLLLHGFTGAKEDFTDWVDPLAARGWWAVAPDHRGHGASSKPADESAYSLEILADDALALADALNWDEFVLLGHSMGGMIAQVLAAGAPDRIAGLILMDTAHGPLSGVDRSQVANGVAVARERGIDALADLMADRESPLTTPAHQRLLDEQPGYREFGERKFRATSPALYAAMLTQMFDQADRLDDLRAVKSPALVVVGEQDTPFIGPSERMADALPNAALTVLPDAGHSPQFENSEAWWDAITAYLDSLPARDG